jgi:uncharacterized membrane protein
MKNISLLLILTSFVLALCFAPYMPELMASHWNAYGQVDDYTTRYFGLFFIPSLSLVLYLVFLLLPKIDPYKKNFSQFEKYYDQFLLVISGFFLYIYLTTIVWNFGISFNIMQVLAPAFAILFYFTGVLMSHAHRNWFVGIRTPWTMSSEVVWKKTHVLGSKLFKLSAIMNLLIFVLPQYAILLLLVPILASSVFIFAYSYWEYRKLIDSAN